MNSIIKTVSYSPRKGLDADKIDPQKNVMSRLCYENGGFF